MKMKILIYAAALASAVAFAPAAVALDEYSGSNHPDVYKGDMRGDVSSPSKIKDYTIGFRGMDNSCMVKEISAESSDHALRLAHQICPTCSLNDLTGEYLRAEAPWEETPVGQTFCSLNLEE